MSPSSRISPFAWLIVPICAAAFLLWTDDARTQRVNYVSGLAGRAGPVDVLDASSPTGYANRQRELIVPERNENSFEWISQTQQMFANGEWRVRHVDYDNAPFGREVNSASPYRWWLGAVAWLHHLVTGRPVGFSVERAALLADPILHGLLLISGTAFVAWRFGAFAAALASIGLVVVFPLAATFLPGAPDARGLAIFCALGCILNLLAGMTAPRPGAGDLASALPDRRACRSFAIAGVIGGIGLWISVSTQVPIVAGIFPGALLAAWIVRRNTQGTGGGVPRSRRWRSWAAGGGITILAAYLIEYFPGHLGSWRLEKIHPLYGLAWIGSGELLAQAEAWITREKNFRAFRDGVFVMLAATAVAAVPVVMWKEGSWGFLAQDTLWARLTSLPNGTVAGSLKAWLVRDGATLAVWATLVPLLVLVPVGWLILRRATPLETRILLAVALGPVLVALGFACWQLSWWSFFDCTLLALVVAATARSVAAGPRPARWLWPAIYVACASLGMTQLWPQNSAGPSLTLTAMEAEELSERDLAHWLAKHAGEERVVAYAPPHETMTVCFYGGLRGIGTFASDNQAGLETTLSIAGVTTFEEVRGLLQGRGVRYLVVPSWDPFFDEFAKLYLAKKFSNRTSFLMHELQRWNLPLWLRPVPYQMPVGGGFEGQSIRVFEVVDEQNPVVAASRLAEYLVEIGELDQAVSASEKLQRFPGDVGALVARAQVQLARGDRAGASQALELMVSRLSHGDDRFLPWDRRVSLAIVLARGNRVDQTLEQVKRCVADVDEDRLRSLSTGSLYSLLVLEKVFGLQIADQRLRMLAVDLLPADLRSRL